MLAWSCTWKLCCVWGPWMCLYAFMALTSLTCGFHPILCPQVWDLQFRSARGCQSLTELCGWWSPAQSPAAPDGAPWPPPGPGATPVMPGTVNGPVSPLVRFISWRTVLQWGEDSALLASPSAPSSSPLMGQPCSCYSLAMPVLLYRAVISAHLSKCNKCLGLSDCYFLRYLRVLVPGFWFLEGPYFNFWFWGFTLELVFISGISDGSLIDEWLDGQVNCLCFCKAFFFSCSCGFWDMVGGHWVLCFICLQSMYFEWREFLLSRMFEFPSLCSY